MHTHTLQQLTEVGRFAQPMIVDTLDNFESSARLSMESSDCASKAVKVFGVMTAKLISWDVAQESWRLV